MSKCPIKGFCTSNKSRCKCYVETRAKLDANPPLIYRIVDAIVASPIEETRKSQALNDLLKMYTVEGYARVTSIENQQSHNGHWNRVSSHHVWDTSDLGWEFWNKLNQVIGTV